MSEAICWLKDIRRQDIGRVGGKCANLGELSQLGISVPDGFCIPTDVYLSCVNQVWPEVDLEIHQIDFENLESLHTHSQRIRDIISRVEISGPIHAEVIHAYHQLVKLTRQEACAVRSSATSEDGEEASSAGQQDTFLGVRGADALLQSIKQCWASLWNERAIVYRMDHGLLNQQASIAVLVQSMLPSQVSGVLFTRDPMTGQNRTLINASWGLGEMLVSGKVNPDECVMSFSENGAQEISYRVGSKEAALWDAQAAPESVSAQQRSSRCLSPEAARQLTVIGQQIEKHFGLPQDIEWGLVDGKVFILQSRPITTIPADLPRLFHEQAADDRSLWTGSFLSERFPQPVSPLGWSIFSQLIEAIGFREPLKFIGFRDQGDLKVFRVYQGHPYVNVRVYQILYKYFPDPFLPSDAHRFFPEGNVALRKEIHEPRLGHFLLGVTRTFFSTIDWTPWHYLKWDRFAQKFNREIARFDQALDQNTDSIEGILAVIPSLRDLVGELLRIHRWSLTYSEGLMAVLKHFLAVWVHPRHLNEQCASLVAGLTNQTTQLDAELWTLSQAARQVNNWKRTLAEPENPDEPSVNTAEAQLRGQFQAFLQKFAHRSISLDIFYPAFGDDPNQVIRLIRLLGEKETDSPIARIEQQRQNRLNAIRELKKELTHGWLRSIFPIQWILVRLLLNFLHIYMRLREDQRFFLQKGLHEHRKAFMKLGRLVFPEDPEAVFFLTVEEIQRVAHQKAARPELLAQAKDRKWAFARIQHSDYPPFLMGNMPFVPAVDSASPDDHEILRGIPVSPGKKTGRARIIAGPADLEKSARFIETGDVLVTKSTDPAWTPILLKINGLIMETGGLLSHGSVVAREYGIPAVVGVSGAIHEFHDGELLEVDGSTGIVTRLGQSAIDQ